MRRDMLVDATAALCTVVRLDPGAPHGLAAEEAMLGTAFALVRPCKTGLDCWSEAHSADASTTSHTVVKQIRG